MFKLIQSGPTGGDCTAPYDVSMDKTYTIKEFVDEILVNYPKEWGYIRVPDSIFGSPGLEYRDGKIISGYDDRWLIIQNHIISSVKASGGWSRMDYIITIISDESDEVTSANEERSKQLAIIESFLRKDCQSLSFREAKAIVWMLYEVYKQINPQ